jgi:hypothetical protein
MISVVLLYRRKYLRMKSRRPLPYATPVRPASRTSNLAVASLLLAILGSPCVALPLATTLRRMIPQGVLYGGWFVNVRFLSGRGWVLTVTALPIAAIVRIAFSRGTRTGIPLALVGLAFAALWWVLLLWVWWTWRNWHMD